MLHCHHLSSTMPLAVLCCITTKLRQSLFSRACTRDTQEEQTWDGTPPLPAPFLLMPATLFKSSMPAVHDMQPQREREISRAWQRIHDCTEVVSKVNLMCFYLQASMLCLVVWIWCICLTWMKTMCYFKTFNLCASIKVLVRLCNCIWNPLPLHTFSTATFGRAACDSLCTFTKLLVQRLLYAAIGQVCKFNTMKALRKDCIKDYINVWAVSSYLNKSHPLSMTAGFSFFLQNSYKHKDFVRSFRHKPAFTLLCYVPMTLYS